jgi:hypothetical protein
MAKKKRPDSPGWLDWKFAGNVRDDAKRLPQIQKAVSEAIKNLGPRTFHRYDKAKKFARKMRIHAWRLRGDESQDFIDAMGVGSGHRWVMVRRYEAAAIAAERFCTSRSR